LDAFGKKKFLPSIQIYELQNSMKKKKKKKLSDSAAPCQLGIEGGWRATERRSTNLINFHPHCSGAVLRGGFNLSI